MPWFVAKSAVSAAATPGEGDLAERDHAAFARHDRVREEGDREGQALGDDALPQPAQEERRGDDADEQHSDRQQASPQRRTHVVVDVDERRFARPGGVSVVNRSCPSPRYASRKMSITRTG